MSEMLAYCGILCSECQAYKATLTNDQTLKEETAKQWSSMYGGNIEAKDINCLGCKSDVLFGHCKVCDIRSCANEKKLVNCGVCGSFACDKVENVLKQAPECRDRLMK